MRNLRSVADAIDAIENAPRTSGRLIVGITGAPGAGKSTVAAAMVEVLGPTAALLPMDGFHLPQATLVEFGRRDRMGAPDTFDVPALLALLAAIRVPIENSGDPLSAPGFDREAEEPVPGAIHISPEISTVVVEGNYLLLDSGGWAAVADYLDLSFFLEIDLELRRSRLIARHEKYGKSPAEARAWALGPDEANARLIETTAARADYRLSL
ncbi:MAG TPA: nucleoside/nucleotide kinase family protein [Galbitalea sp.]|nr:nucleoside/nucleotide kinase family protein [Galbitalea sp.]